MIKKIKDKEMITNNNAGTATEPKWTGHMAAPLFMFTALAPTILTIRHQLIMGISCLIFFFRTAGALKVVTV